MPVERPCQHHAQQVDCRLRMPAPAALLDHAGRARRQIIVIGLPHGLGCQVRVDVDRHIEIYGGRQQAIVARVVEKAPFRRAVHERADKAQLLHRAHQLSSAGVGALHRQHREAREAIRMAGDGRCQMVVHLARDGDALGARHEVRAGTGVGEHLDGDAGLVHGPQAPLADLGQQLAEVWALRGRCSRPETAAGDGGRIDTADQGGNGEMLFKGDDTHALSSGRPAELSHPLSTRGKRDHGRRSLTATARGRCHRPERGPSPNPGKTGDARQCLNFNLQRWYPNVHFSNRSLMSSVADAEIEE